MLAAGGPLLNRRNEKRGGVVFLRDITDRKKSDEQLKVALLESEALAKERRELSELGDLLESCKTVEEAYKLSKNALSNILDSGLARCASSIRHATWWKRRSPGTTARRPSRCFIPMTVGRCGVGSPTEAPARPCRARTCARRAIR